MTRRDKTDISAAKISPLAVLPYRFLNACLGLVVSLTSSHILHSIFITHTHNCHKFNCSPSPPPVVSSHTGRRKMAARGGFQRAKTRPPIGCQMHASSQGGRGPHSAGPQRIKGRRGLVGVVERVQSRPAGLQALANPQRGQAHQNTRQQCPQNTYSSRLESQDH